MYRLVRGTCSVSLVGCILQPSAYETRIYIADAADELVKSITGQTEWRTAQIYLKIDHAVGFFIQASGLRVPLAEMILEVDNGHYTLWSREGQEKNGSQLPLPDVEMCFLPAATADHTSSSLTVLGLMAPFLKK